MERMGEDGEAIEQTHDIPVSPVIMMHLYLIES